MSLEDMTRVCLAAAAGPVIEAVCAADIELGDILASDDGREHIVQDWIEVPSRDVMLVINVSDGTKYSKTFHPGDPVRIVLI